MYAQGLEKNFTDEFLLTKEYEKTLIESRKQMKFLASLLSHNNHIQVEIFWVVMPCSFVVDNNVLEDLGDLP
jgi:hypothetical protein